MLKKAKSTPRISEIQKIKKCCKRIIIFDRNNLGDCEINNLKRKLLNNDSMLITSSPSIECVLYSIFDIPDSELSKKSIKRKTWIIIK